MPLEVILIIFLGCATGMAFFVIDRIFPKRGAMGSRDIQQLRESVRQLEQRMQNIETIVTGAEFQAAQRIASALESGSTAAEKNTLGVPPSRMSNPTHNP